WLGPANHGAHHGRNLTLPIILFLAGDLRQLAQAFGNAGIKLTFEERQERVPHSIASEFQLAVGGVLAPRLPDTVEVGFQIATANVKKRPGDRSAWGPGRAQLNARL